MKICLVMIVKNEAHCIERCLVSTLPIIDCWSIVDTGSTDGTQDKIKAFFQEKGVPGILHEKPWKNFEVNRTESIELARNSDAEYGLCMDADDALEFPENYQLPKLEADSYRVQVEHSGTTHFRTHLFKLSKPFKYVGVIHECIVCEGLDLETEPVLKDVIYRVYPEGARSRGDAVQKFLRDADVLREALRKEPNHARYSFYLAQCYRDAGKIEKAIQAYERRALINGWVEENWFSMNEIARLNVWLRKPEQTIVQAFLRAYEYRPGRVEPLYELAFYYRTIKNRPQVAFIYAAAGYGTPRPSDRLFVDSSIYEWRLEYEYAIASYYVGKMKESKAAHENLLVNSKVLPEERAAIEKNMKFFET